MYPPQQVDIKDGICKRVLSKSHQQITIIRSKQAPIAEIVLTLCQGYRHSSQYAYTKARWLIAISPVPHTPSVSPRIPQGTRS